MKGISKANRTTKTHFEQVSVTKLKAGEPRLSRKPADGKRQRLIGTSVVWIESQRTRGFEATSASLRSGGLFPVCVESVDGALDLLRQFQVGVVVLQVADGGGWAQCARLLAVGSPVAVLIDSFPPELIDRYLSAGCAAVIAASCRPDTVTAALCRVAAGHRDVVCIEASQSKSEDLHPRRPDATVRAAAQEPATPAHAEPNVATRKGRRASHAERWTKVTVVLMDRQIVFLDRLTADIRAAHRVRLSRAHLIRALVDGLAESDLDLTNSRSERDLINVLEHAFVARATT